MKNKYYVVDNNGNIIQVPFAYKLGEAILATIKAGLDEGVTGWSSSWQELDPNDVRFILNNSDPTHFTVVMNGIRESVRELLLDDPFLNDKKDSNGQS